MISICFISRASFRSAFFDSSTSLVPDISRSSNSSSENPEMSVSFLPPSSLNLAADLFNWLYRNVFMGDYDRIDLSSETKLIWIFSFSRFCRLRLSSLSWCPRFSSVLSLLASFKKLEFFSLRSMLHVMSVVYFNSCSKTWSRVLLLFWMWWIWRKRWELFRGSMNYESVSSLQSNGDLLSMNRLTWLNYISLLKYCFLSFSLSWLN